MTHEEIVREYISRTSGLGNVIAKIEIVARVNIKISFLDRPFREYLNLYSDLLFNPDRAREFWGDICVCQTCGELNDCLAVEHPVTLFPRWPAWKVAQNKMLALIQDGDDPLMEIEKFLTKNNE